MGRKAQLEPAWLVGLLNAWAVRSHHDHSKGLGWYSICPMLKSGIPTKARSYEPTGYSGQDFRDVYEALQELELMQRMAIGRYFKPWAKAGIEAEFLRSDYLWRKDFAAAMAKLEQKLRIPVAQLRVLG